MKLTIADPRYLRDSISVISELVNEVSIKFDKDGMEIIAMDPANVAMVVFRLLSSAFVEYDIKQDISFNVNLENFKQILKRAKPNDNISLDLDEDLNRLNISLIGDSKRNFSMSLLDAGDKEQKVPSLNFSAKILINSLNFNELIEDMGIVGESVNFEVKDGKLIVHSDGNFGSGKAEVLTSGDTKIEGVGKARYSLEYLRKIAKGGKLSDNIILEFSKDYPLKVEYKVVDKLVLATILAPRVSND